MEGDNDHQGTQSRQLQMRAKGPVKETHRHTHYTCHNTNEEGDTEDENDSSEEDDVGENGTDEDHSDNNDGEDITKDNLPTVQQKSTYEPGLEKYQHISHEAVSLRQQLNAAMAALAASQGYDITPGSPLEKLSREAMRMYFCEAVTATIPGQGRASRKVLQDVTQESLQHFFDNLRNTQPRRHHFDEEARSQRIAAAQKIFEFKGRFQCGDGGEFRGRYDTGADGNFISQQAIDYAGLRTDMQLISESNRALFLHVSDGDDSDGVRGGVGGTRTSKRYIDEPVRGHINEEVEGYIISHQAARKLDVKVNNANRSSAPRHPRAKINGKFRVEYQIFLKWYDQKAQRGFQDWFYVLRNSPYDVLLGPAFVLEHGLLTPEQPKLRSVLPLVRVPQSKKERAAELARVRDQEAAAARAEEARMAQIAERFAIQYANQNSHYQAQQQYQQNGGREL